MTPLVVEYSDAGEIDSCIELSQELDVRYESTPEESVGTAVAGPPGPPGPQGAPGVFNPENVVIDEEPNGFVNGSNATFTSQFPFVPESVEVFINGLSQRRVVDFNTFGLNTITLSESPTPGESIRINYLRS